MCSVHRLQAILIVILSWHTVSNGNLRPLDANFTKPQLKVLNEHHNCVNRLIFSTHVIAAGE